MQLIIMEKSDQCHFCMLCILRALAIQKMITHGFFFFCSVLFLMHPTRFLIILNICEAVARFSLLTIHKVLVVF